LALINTAAFSSQKKKNTHVQSTLELRQLIWAAGSTNLATWQFERKSIHEKSYNDLT
jgi:hypothetical protein